MSPRGLSYNRATTIAEYPVSGTAVLTMPADIIPGHASAEDSWSPPAHSEQRPAFPSGPFHVQCSLIRLRPMFSRSSLVTPLRCPHTNTSFKPITIMILFQALTPPQGFCTKSFYSLACSFLFTWQLLRVLQSSPQLSSLGRRFPPPLPH